MPGVTLSRWTMSYFAAALIFLLIAELLMVAGYGYPATAIAAPETLILVHVTAIGWLSLLLCGALFQFVPVLIAHPIHSQTLPLPALAFLIAGLGALIAGFLQLAGFIAPHALCFPVAGFLLSIGFALVLWNLGKTLWAARPLTLPARFVTVGLLSIAATVLIGVIFTLVLGGLTEHGHFINLLQSGVPVHAVAGLVGWLTFIAMGVSYRLLAMFMLAPELDGPTTRSALYLGAAALGVAILGGVPASMAGIGPTIPLLIGFAIGLLALGFYARDILYLYRTRRRRKIELNSRMAAIAVGNLAAAIVLLIALLISDNVDRYIGAVVFLFAFGWLSGLGLAKLYKITAFLTWLECYGPALGKGPTPRVQDLVTEPRAIKWFWLYFATVWCGTIFLIAEIPLGFRITSAIMLIATIAIINELLRARRLLDVKAEIRMPKGASSAHLLYAQVKKA